ncbi:MAG: hypothetical protein WA208_05920 [Thermoanaerobaculia bacterium]
MRANRFAVIAVLITLVALPAAAQVNDTYVIAAAANSPGAFGTRWMTQFSLFNPQLQYDLWISVTYVPTSGGQAIEELVDVPRNSVAYSDNILADLFGVTGGGSLLVAAFPEDNPGVPNDVLSRSFLVTSNTFNNSSAGTFGQTIPGVWAGLMQDEITAVAHGIRNIDRLGWRTNIGAVNLGRCNVTLLLNVYDANGRTVAEALPFEIPPMAHFQDKLPYQVDRGSVEFWISDPCASSATNYAVVFPYTSTIDELSGDPTYQVPSLLANPNVLYGKKAVAAVDTTSLGKKIGVAEARLVREKAERRGTAKLVRDEDGRLRITK